MQLDLKVKKGHKCRLKDFWCTPFFVSPVALGYRNVIPAAPVRHPVHAFVHFVLLNYVATHCPIDVA
jgi:hypothetical protein